MHQEHNQRRLPRLMPWVEIRIISLGDCKNQKTETDLLWCYIGPTSRIVAVDIKRGKLRQHRTAGQ
jgi:hypothetical protein